MSNQPIDLDLLLAPLDIGETGVGVDLRLDYSASSLYQQLRDARAAARAEERARDAADESETTPADGWRRVLTVAQQALLTGSKDMEVAAWLAEALVRLHGLPGLTAGASLLGGLCDRYWEAGFPQPDEDGLEARASPLGGLSGGSSDGTIMQPLRRMPIFRRADGTGLGIYQWEQAEHTASLPEDKRDAKIAAGAPELATLEAEARLDKAYLAGTWRDASEALQAWRELIRVVDLRFGSDAPSLRKVTALLEQIVALATRLGGAPAAAEIDPGQAEATDLVAGAAPAAGSGRGLLMTRDDALRDLDRIADFFRRTEPHSPLAYTLDEAVRRGRMSLAELLAEVLPDADARNSMLQRLGIRTENA